MKGINFNNVDVDDVNSEIDKNILNLSELYSNINKISIEKLLTLRHHMLLKRDPALHNEPIIRIGGEFKSDYTLCIRYLENIINDIIQKKIDYIANNDGSFEDIKTIMEEHDELFFNYKIPNKLIIRYFNYLDNDSKMFYLNQLDLNKSIKNESEYNNIELLKLYCENNNELILRSLFSKKIIQEQYIDLLLKVKNKNIQDLAKYAEKFLKIRFFPSDRTIFSYKLDKEIDCHLFPIIEKMSTIGINVKKHCHGNHLEKFFSSDYLTIKVAYIDIKNKNCLATNSFIKYAKEKDMYIEKFFYIDRSDQENRDIADILCMGGNVFESDIKLCLNVYKTLSYEGKTILNNLLNSDRYNYRISSFKLDFDEVSNSVFKDNYIHQVYVKNDIFIQYLYDYFI